jgi:hypothetical protein
VSVTKINDPSGDMWPRLRPRGLTSHILYNATVSLSPCVCTVAPFTTLADSKSTRVIRFYGSFFGRIVSIFECFATSVRFEGVLATRFVIRIAFGIVRFTFGNFVVFHIHRLVRVGVAFRLSQPPQICANPCSDVDSTAKSPLSAWLKAVRSFYLQRI